jgi:hypothetical protein
LKHKDEQEEKAQLRLTAGRKEAAAKKQEAIATEDAAEGAYLGLEALRSDEQKHSFESAIDREKSAHKMGKATEHAMKSAQDSDMAVLLRQQAGPASSSASTDISSGSEVGTSLGTDVIPSAGGRVGSSTGVDGNTVSDSHPQDDDSASAAK